MRQTTGTKTFSARKEGKILALACLLILSLGFPYARCEAGAAVSPQRSTVEKSTMALNWFKWGSEGYKQELSSLFVLPDGDIIVGGINEVPIGFDPSSTQKNSQSYLARFDRETGSLLWERNLGEDDEEESITRVVGLSGNRILGIGTTQKGGMIAPYLVCVGEDGDILWEKRFEKQEGAWDILWDCVETRKGMTCVAVGTTLRTIDGGERKRGGWLIEINLADGTTIRERVLYHNPHTGGPDELRFVLHKGPEDGDRLVCGGSCSVPGESSPQDWLVEVSFDTFKQVKETVLERGHPEGAPPEARIGGGSIGGLKARGEEAWNGCYTVGWWETSGGKREGKIVSWDKEGKREWESGYHLNIPSDISPSSIIASTGRRTLSSKWPDWEKDGTITLFDLIYITKDNKEHRGWDVVRLDEGGNLINRVSSSSFATVYPVVSSMTFQDMGWSSEEEVEVVLCGTMMENTEDKDESDCLLAFLTIPREYQDDLTLVEEKGEGFGTVIVGEEKRLSSKTNEESGPGVVNGAGNILKTTEIDLTVRSNLPYEVKVYATGDLVSEESQGNPPLSCRNLYVEREAEVGGGFVPLEKGTNNPQTIIRKDGKTGPRGEDYAIDLKISVPLDSPPGKYKTSLVFLIYRL
ncbi:MAG: hypothetical protein QXH08_00280 [Candidatus Hadarchaeales archaeon]